MCRPTEDPSGFYRNSWRSRRRDRLNIRAFYLRFSITSCPVQDKAQARKENSLPRSLTLHYLPRISGTPLDINDAPIPSDTSAFVTLHRVTPSNSPLGETTKEVVFASRERVRASEGVRFEVYWREEMVLKGVFRRKDYDDDEHFIDFIGEWKVDCRCALENALGLGLLEVSHADVCLEIEGDGHRVLSDKVEMADGRNRTKKKKKKSRGFIGLEEIPEVREVDDDDDSVPDGDSSSSCSSCCCGGGGGGGGGELESKFESEEGVSCEISRDEEKEELEMEMEGVRWAVDVGIWVLCLGVGYLVSRASSNSFRRRRRSFLF